MAFRHNANATAYPVHSITLDAWLSSAATTSTTASTTFDVNHGADKRQVVTNRLYNLPASEPGDLPGQFVLNYAYDTPFPFPGNASLCWEVQITVKTHTASIFHDALLGANANPNLQSSRAYTGCISTGRTNPMALSPLQNMNWAAGTGTINASATQLVPNGPVLFMRGFSRLNWGGIPLPFEIPGSANAPSGACFLYTDVWVITPSVASASGSVTNPFTVPATPDLNGLTVFTQAWGLDAPANPIGITTSNLVMHNFLAPYGAPPISRIYASGSLNPTGILNVNVNVLPTLFY
jgi:hypothetical protein